MVEFGVSIRPNGEDAIEETASLVKLAEDVGLDSAWLLDSQLICSDVYVNLTASALRTSKIKLSPGVTNVLTRHPAVTANAIASIDKVSKGRALLGIGSGDSAVQGMGLRPGTLKQTEEYIGLVKGLLAGETVSYNGKEIRIFSSTERNVPVHLSVSQKRMCELSGKVAEGAVIIGSTDPSLLKKQMEWVRAGANAAGKNPEEMEMNYYVGFSVSNDAEKAREEVRAFATSRARWFASWDESLLPAEILALKKSLGEIRLAYDFLEHMKVDATHHGSVENLLTDKMIDMFAVGGDVEYCISKFKAIKATGVHRIVPLLLSHDRADVINTLGKEIAPALRG